MPQQQGSAHLCELVTDIPRGSNLSLELLYSLLQRPLLCACFVSLLFHHSHTILVHLARFTRIVQILDLLL